MFEDILISLGRNHSKGNWVRRDCLYCSPLMMKYNIWEYNQPHVNLRLAWMVFNGWIEKRYINHSIFASANEQPFYHLKAPGVEYLHKRNLLG